MRIIVSGASGLIGSSLLPTLKAAGHEPIALVRREAGAGELRWDPAAGMLPADALEGADAVVHLAGAGIGDHRWTDEYKRELIDSRVRSTTLLAETIAACTNGPKVLLSGSAIGYYGASDGRDLDETSPAGDDFLANLCVQWERATAAAAEKGTRVVHLRTGIVLSRDGGALAKMLPLFKLFAGGRFGNGKQWQSWISLPDEVGAIVHLLSADVSGPVNLTAPNPVTNAEFTDALGEALHRPTFLTLPRALRHLPAGVGPLVESLLFTSDRVLPRALEASGFTFAHPDLATALPQVLGRS